MHLKNHEPTSNYGLAQLHTAELIAAGMTWESSGGRLNTPSISNGSPLDFDDQADLSMLSGARSRELILRAEDAGRSAGTFFSEWAKGAREDPPYTFFTLARSCLEISASAFWLLRPRNQESRLRRMAGYLKKDALQAARLDGVGPFRSAPSSHRGDLVEFPSATRLLRSASAALPDLSVSPLQVWQLCSAVTHGLNWAFSELPGFTPDDGTTPIAGAPPQEVARRTVLSTILVTTSTYRLAYDRFLYLANQVGPTTSPLEVPLSNY